MSWFDVFFFLGGGFKSLTILGYFFGFRGFSALITILGLFFGGFQSYNLRISEAFFIVIF